MISNKFREEKSYVICGRFFYRPWNVLEVHKGKGIYWRRRKVWGSRRFDDNTRRTTRNRHRCPTRGGDATNSQERTNSQAHSTNES